MPRLPRLRRKGTSEQLNPLAETIPAPARVPPPRGFDSTIPLGGTTMQRPGGDYPESRAEFMSQLYGAYAACTWSSACVDAVARTCTAGGVELQADVAPGDDTPVKPPAEAGRLQDLLDFVNPREDIRQLMRGQVTDLQVYGDAFIEISWLLDVPVALYSLDSATMLVLADEHGAVAGYAQILDGQRIALFKPHEVIHTSLDAPRGSLYGVGPTQKTLLPITTWLFTQALLKETMRKGNPPRLAVDLPLEVSGPEEERFRQRYATTHVGISNLGNLLTIRGDGKAALHELKASSVTEYLTTLDTQRDNILSGYGVPPAKVGVIESGNLGGGTGSSQDKALDLATPIPTPTGWTTMGQLTVGDEVLDEHGRPCRVVGTYEVPDARSWRLNFSDSTHIDACEDHLWVTWTHADRKAYGRASNGSHDKLPTDWVNWRTRRGTGPQVRRTADVLSTLHTSQGRNNHSVPVTGALQLPAVDLPIEPYVLGAWLGDGTAVHAAITCGAGDEQILDEIRTAGHTVVEHASARASGRTASYGIGGLRPLLRGAGLLGDKHVPAAYLRASAEQRLALLQGLMDTDGGFSSGQQVLFRSTSERLADAVVELARSLGQKPVKAKGTARLNGVECGPQYAVTWTPTIQVFRLARKAVKWAPKSRHMQLWHRTIASAEKIPDRPMRCIRVDSPNAMYLAGDGMIPTHNTFKVNTCGPLNELTLEKWNYALTRQGFGLDGWKIGVREVDWRDDKVIDEIDSQRLRDGRITLNRARAAIDEPPVDGGDVPILVDRQNLVAWADMPEYSRAVLTALQSKAPAAGSGGVPLLPGQGAESVDLAVLQEGWGREYARLRRESLGELSA